MKNLIFLFVTYLIISSSAFGQPDAPCDPFTDPFCTEPPPEEQIPVDGGIAFLTIAGAAWGIKRLRKKD